jgi:SAM-dependent methyltransferase
MGFETLILRGLCPGAVVDCLGIAPDGRFLPGGEGAFFAKDLNEPGRGDAVPEGAYDLIVFMEVLEHLCVPPDLVLAYLRRLLVPGGVLLLTTPNAAWLKNRLKLLCGRNPFELLRADPENRGHIREYTGAELVAYVAKAGLELGYMEARGLYTFDNPKDNFYSWLADHCHPSLSRSLVVCARRPS